MNDFQRVIVMNDLNWLAYEKISIYEGEKICKKNQPSLRLIVKMMSYSCFFLR